MLDQGQATCPDNSHKQLTRLATGKHVHQEQIIRGHACKRIPKQEQEWYAYNPFIVKDWAEGQR